MGFWGTAERYAVDGVAGVAGAVGGAAEDLAMAGGEAIPYVNAALDAVAVGGAGVAAGVHGIDAAGHGIAAGYDYLSGDTEGAEAQGKIAGAQAIDAGVALVPFANQVGAASDLAHTVAPENRTHRRRSRDGRRRRHLSRSQSRAVTASRFQP